MNRITFSLYTILLPLFISYSLFAQETDTLVPPSRDNPALHIGVTMGGTLSLINSVPSLQQNPHYGATTGVAFQVENSPYTAFHSTLQYTLRGWNEKNPQTSKEAAPLLFIRQLHYLELLLHTHLYFPIGAFRLGLSAGPQIGALIFSKDQSSTPSLFPEIAQMRHQLPLVGRFAWGLSGGPAFALNIGNHRIELNALFYLGFNNLLPTKLSDYYRSFGEMMLSVNLAYLFRIN